MRPTRRARHYGAFYGLDPVPTDRPLLLVHGNCQAESLRGVLQATPDAPCARVRIPPVHEVAADEVPLLERLLRRARRVLTQPIADDYRDRPLGSHQVARQASRATTMGIPSSAVPVCIRGRSCITTPGSVTPAGAVPRRPNPVLCRRSARAGDHRRRHPRRVEVVSGRARSP